MKHERGEDTIPVPDVMRALNDLSDHLCQNQVRLSRVEKDSLYGNLWDLYE